MYGIAFLVLGNLSGNAIQLGKFAMSAFGYDDPSKGAVLGIAIAALTFAVVIHMFSRRGGIFLNNVFAVYKVGLLLAMICMGIARKCGATFGRPQNETKQTTNFENPFPGTVSSLANYSDSLLFILYSYSGFKQPFYVVSEVETPRRIFPWATTTAVLFQWTLFVLVNVAYLWVVDLSILQEGKEDIATLFVEALFGNDSPTPKRAMNGLLALSILGNIIVMTCEEDCPFSALDYADHYNSYRCSCQTGDCQGGCSSLVSQIRHFMDNTMVLRKGKVVTAPENAI